MVKLEICVDNPVSFINAVAGGADRIELCAALNSGGMTPSMGFIEWALAYTKIPVRVMIRNRGGDFVYDDCDMACMMADVKRLPNHPMLEGIVFGALRMDNTIDTDNVHRILDTTDVKCTFHRAFDWCIDYRAALSTLSQVAIDTVLTSGQRADAWQALDTLAHMGTVCGDIQIMSCAGFAPTPDKIQQLHRAAPAAWIHMAAATVWRGNVSSVPMGGDEESENMFITQTEMVASVHRVLQRL